MAKNEITYPARWEYRVFVERESFDAAREILGNILAEQDEHAELTDGGRSSSGKFLALRARAEVGSKSDAETLGRRLAAVPGVKFVL